MTTITRPIVDIATTKPFACSEMQRQGDLLVIPIKATLKSAAPMTGDGIVVLHSKNNHVLVGDENVMFERRIDSMTVGAFTVGEGSAAVLLHNEHGSLTFGPGTYVCRRQRSAAGTGSPVVD